MKITVDLFSKFDAIIPQLRRDIHELTRDEYKELFGLIRAIKNAASVGSLNNNLIVKNKPMYELASVAIWSIAHALVNQNKQWYGIAYNAPECMAAYKPENGSYYIKLNYSGDSRKFVGLEDSVRAFSRMLGM
ncbi:hypothetical protein DIENCEPHELON_27 [Klebsiella phage vB_KaeS_Diencephalon]|nr:hypothetical protein DIENCEPHELON_27 [Klebsiella phage vB_KaeS_Diencephalon]